MCIYVIVVHLVLRCSSILLDSSYWYHFLPSQSQISFAFSREFAKQHLIWIVFYCFRSLSSLNFITQFFKH